MNYQEASMPEEVATDLNSPKNENDKQQQAAGRSRFLTTHVSITQESLKA